MKRRTVIKGLAAIAPLASVNQLKAQTAPPPAGTCRLISHDVLGPFAIDQPPKTGDLAPNLPGMPLQLKFLIQDAYTCNPLPGALVSIWHADVEGLYSGVNNIVLDENMQPTGETIDYTDKTWLRGVQQADESGMVVFNTIVPGWYFPRATHLHLQVFPPNYGEVATTQLYFPDEACDEVYKTEGYAHRGPNKARTDPTKDAPLDGTDEGDLWLTMKPNGAGMMAEHTIGVSFYGDMFGPLPDVYKQG